MAIAHGVDTVIGVLVLVVLEAMGNSLRDLAWLAEGGLTAAASMTYPSCAEETVARRARPVKRSDRLEEARTYRSISRGLAEIEAYLAGRQGTAVE
jgi:hypothetical protein